MARDVLWSRALALQEEGIGVDLYYWTKLQNLIWGKWSQLETSWSKRNSSLVPLVLSMCKALYCVWLTSRRKGKKKWGPEEAWRSKAHIALAEYPSLNRNIHSGHIQRLVTLAKGIWCLWPLRAPVLMCTYPYTNTQRQTQKYKDSHR